MALGLLPDVEYSVENGRTDGQRAGVIVFVLHGFTGWQDDFVVFGWMVVRQAHHERANGILQRACHKRAYGILRRAQDERVGWGSRV